MSTATLLDRTTVELLRDAARWRVLGRLFECPDDSWLADLMRLVSELDAEEVSAAVGAVNETATPGQYYSVFGPGGPAPPREASYHDSLELGSLMTEIAGYYEAFGYRSPCSEPPDHVAVEVGFVAYLRFKEAFAHVHGEEDHARIARAAAEQFMRDHLARLGAPLSALLAESPLAYLTEASRLLAAWVGPPPSSAFLPMLPAAVDDDDTGEFECGVP